MKLEAIEKSKNLGASLLPKRSLLRALALRILLLFFGLVLPLLVLETLYRFESFRRNGTPFFQNPRYRWDEVLGWTGREHRLGSETAASRIVVLGDSFTEGMGVGAESLWFSHVQHAGLTRDGGDTQIVAYGGLGFGTLQEILVLERYKKQFEPAAIVVQLCSNDLINNYLPLERLSYLQRAPAPRPYLIAGNIELRFPRQADQWLTPLISYSRVAYRYNNRWDELLARWANERRIHSVEFDIQTSGFSFPLFREAIAVTRELLLQLKSVSAPILPVLVLVDDLEPYTRALRDIARDLGLTIFVPPRVNPYGPEDRLPDGTHLNERGNQKLGSTLATMLRNRAQEHDWAGHSN